MSSALWNRKAGDAVIFTETLTHGTPSWTGKHQRRALPYRFSPGFQAYSAGQHAISYPNYIETWRQMSEPLWRPTSAARRLAHTAFNRADGRPPGS